MALSEDILKLKDVFNGANPSQAGMNQAGGASDPISSFEESILSMDPNRSAGLSPFGQTGIDAGNRFRDSILQSSQAPQVAAPQPLMTPELAAQREADRGGPGDPNAPMPSFLGQVGQTASELFVKPMERLGQAAGEQKYGTGLSASGEAVGQPINPNTFAGQMATLPGTALNVAGLATDPISSIPNLAGQAAEYFTGADIVSGGPTSAIPTPSRAAVDSVSDQAGAATIPTGAEGSPQANFAARMASGKPLSSAEIEQANALATSMSTTFNPATGYSRDPFLSAQGQTGGAPTSVENTQAEIQRRFGAPTVSGALSAPIGLGLRTDPQGRMIPAGFETRAEAYPSYEMESAAREARAAEQFGVPRGPDSRDRDRRGTMSKADAVKLTGGDRVAADALLKRQELGLGEFAPEKETRPPEQIEQEQLANERSRQIIEQANKPDATAFQKKRGEWQERAEDLRESGASDKEIEARRRAFLYGDTFDPYEFQKNQGTGETTPESESAPSGKTDEPRQGEQRKQKGVVYEFDGKNWKAVK